MSEVSPEKVQAFVKEYGKLREKYGIDFMQVPSFVQAPLPDGTPAWALVVTPHAYQIGIPSTFMSNDNGTSTGHQESAGS